MINEGLQAELIERAERDQRARRSLRPGHSSEEWNDTVALIDDDNVQRLREIIATHGWPGHALVGPDGASSAWLIAQHSPPEDQERFLPLLTMAVEQGDAEPRDLAYLTDRVLKHRGLPQRYGTQYTADRERELVLLWQVDDPDRLDERRASLGLEPEAENRARLQDIEFPEHTT